MQTTSNRKINTNQPNSIVMKHLLEIQLIIEDGITYSEMLELATAKLYKACEASGVKFKEPIISDFGSTPIGFSTSQLRRIPKLIMRKHKLRKGIIKNSKYFDQRVKEVMVAAAKDAEIILTNA